MHLFAFSISIHMKRNIISNLGSLGDIELTEKNQTNVNDAYGRCVFIGIEFKFSRLKFSRPLTCAFTCCISYAWLILRQLANSNNHRLLILSIWNFYFSRYLVLLPRVYYGDDDFFFWLTFTLTFHTLVLPYSLYLFFFYSLPWHSATWTLYSNHDFLTPTLMSNSSNRKTYSVVYINSFLLHPPTWSSAENYIQTIIIVAISLCLAFFPASLFLLKS